MKEIDVRFEEDGTYYVDGKKFTFSGKGMKEHDLAMLLGRVGALKQFASNFDSYLDALALARVLIKSGLLVSIPNEWPPIALFAKQIDEYEKLGGKVDKLG
jgi:hypothetical protein